MNISVVGLGKLGLCTAAYFASKGHNVIGVEKNEHFINQLKEHRCPIKETGLQDLLDKSWDNLRLTTDIQSAVMQSEITLIIVPTPSMPDGKFTNDYINEVLQQVGSALKLKNDFHVVDVVSTVMPGSSDNVFKPLLEKRSGKVCGKDFGLVYNPEFIALGSVIRDFSKPDMVLIGASDKHSSQLVEKLYLSSCKNKPCIASMSLINAEITKLSLNCFVTMKISFANELASICEKVSGANIDAVTEAIGKDTRIGSKYLKGGLGFGGPCFPRDNLAFQAFARDTGMDVKLGPQVVSINKSVVDRLLSVISQNSNGSKKLAILGLSYKPGTHIVEESQSIMLAQKLVEAGYEVSVHDPQAIDTAKDILGESVIYHNDIYSCVKDAGAVVVMTNWPQYHKLDWQKVATLVADDALILDSWRILKNISLKRLSYVALGSGLDISIQCNVV